MSLRECQQRVNQKMSFARKQVDWLATVERDPLARGSALEGAVLHLVGAYKALLAEIAADPHFPDGLDTNAASALMMAGDGQVFVPAALGHCAELERGDGWLSSLLAAAATVERVQVLELKPGPARGLIVAASAEENRLDEAAVRAWTDALQGLIEGLREAQVEY